MAIVVGKRITKIETKIAREKEKLKDYRKAERDRFQREEVQRRKKIAGKLLTLAAVRDDARRVLELVVDQLRKEPGAGLFDNWAMPSPAGKAEPKGRTEGSANSPIDAPANQEAALADPEPHFVGDEEAVLPDGPARGEPENGRQDVRWAGRFPTSPGSSIRDQIKALGGRWEATSSTWNGKACGEQLLEIERLVERAGGQFSTSPVEPVARE